MHDHADHRAIAWESAKLDAGKEPMHLVMHAMPRALLPLVIYHANCADGFTAAWAVHKAMPAEFHAGVYGNPPPNVTGRDVIMVDFCYNADVMLQLQRTARSILVLDHHKSAAAELPHEPSTAPDALTVYHADGSPDCGYADWAEFQHMAAWDRDDGATKAIIYALIDQQRSGAGIAWDFFHPGVPRPALVNHVEDRDLWRFALPGTREIQAAVFSRPYTFAAWDALAAMAPAELQREGAVLERKHHKDVAELVAACRRRIVIAGHDIPVASIPYTMASDAGAILAQGEHFAACYYDTAHTREFSLRSHADGVDVSIIAGLYGGGGHARAAGFRVPRDHELAKA